MAPNGCGECAGDHVCEFPHGRLRRLVRLASVWASTNTDRLGRGRCRFRSRRDALRQTVHWATTAPRATGRRRDDGHLWHADTATCEDYPRATTRERDTCDPTTNIAATTKTSTATSGTSPCGYDHCSDDDDDDDCTPGCRHDGTPMAGWLRHVRPYARGDDAA